MFNFHRTVVYTSVYHYVDKCIYLSILNVIGQVFKRFIPQHLDIQGKKLLFFPHCITPQMCCACIKQVYAGNIFLDSVTHSDGILGTVVNTKIAKLKKKHRLSSHMVNSSCNLQQLICLLVKEVGSQWLHRESCSFMKKASQIEQRAL